MSKNLERFGQQLKKLRKKEGHTLRAICKLTGYDPSNWSKIERGKLSPPRNENTLKNWAKSLKLNPKETEKFISQAQIAQGIIPDSIMSKEQIVANLPAFFRTLRGDKPSKEEVDRLIEIIKKSS